MFEMLTLYSNAGSHSGTMDRRTHQEFESIQCNVDGFVYTVVKKVKIRNGTGVSCSNCRKWHQNKSLMDCNMVTQSVHLSQFIGLHRRYHQDTVR